MTASQQQLDFLLLKEDRRLEFHLQQLSVSPFVAAGSMSVAGEGQHFTVCCGVHQL